MKIKTAQSIFGVALLLMSGFALTAHAADVGTTTVADGIKSIKNIPYVTGAGPSQQLDLYLPETSTTLRPLIILIHGGGWAVGDKSDFTSQCQTFVKRGYVTASLNYRFSNQAVFPAPVIDCKAAIRWLRANAGTHHFDPSRFVAGGISAGGHLSAFLGVTNGVKEFDLGENLRQSSDVQAVIWLAGVSDFVTRAQMPGYEGEQAPDSVESREIGGAVLQNLDRAKKISPINYVNRKSVPFIFFHGDKDQIVPFAQAAELYGALTAYGIPCELHPLAGGSHDTPFFLTPQMYDQIDAFLGRTLKIKSL